MLTWFIAEHIKYVGIHATIPMHVYIANFIKCLYTFSLKTYLYNTYGSTHNDVVTVLIIVPKNTPAIPKFSTNRMEITRFNTASIRDL